MSGPEAEVVGLDELAFNDAGLVPVVVQQHDTGEVLMVAWADAAAIQRTVECGEAVYYSRSRAEQWHKGATSGNTQRLVGVRVDCDADVVLYLVDQGGDGVACHTGERSCFHRTLEGAPTPPAPTASAPPLPPPPGGPATAPPARPEAAPPGSPATAPPGRPATAPPGRPAVPPPPPTTSEPDP